MRYSLILKSVIAVALLLGGCGMPKLNPKSLNPFSGDKSFDPDRMLDAHFAISPFPPKKAIDLRRDGVTFSDGTFLTRHGVGPVHLPKGFRFITLSGGKILAADNSGVFKLIDARSGKILHSAKLDYPLVSAMIRGGRIFYVTQDNHFGVYNLRVKKSVIEAKVGRAYAVDTRVANPISLGALLIVPTLDGKLLIINPFDPRQARGIAITGSKELNNIIFLKRLGRRIIAATPNKLISAAAGSNHKIELPIADMAISGGKIYLLTQDGQVLKLSSTLKILAKRRFPYARFAAIAVSGGKVFALARNGALIVMDRSLKRSRIYDVGEVEDYAFAAGDKLYKDEEIIDLSKLSY